MEYFAGLLPAPGPVCRGFVDRLSRIREEKARIFSAEDAHDLINHHKPMRSLILLPVTALLLAACQSSPKKSADWDVPLTLRTVGPAYADYVIGRADAKKDGTVTLVEWRGAGGTEKCFLLVDQNKDGAVTRTELIRFSSNKKFLDLTRRYTDFYKDNKMTPRDFRSPSGVRLMRIEF
jgi:hypothetical protein